MIHISPYQGIKIDTIVFNLEWNRNLKDYPDELRHEVLDAIYDFIDLGETKDLGPLANMAFLFIKPQVEAYIGNYLGKIEKCSMAGKISASKKRSAKSEPVPDDEYQVYPGVDADTFLDQFFANNRKASIQGLCKNFKSDEATLKSVAVECVVEWQSSNESHADFSKAAYHLMSHIRCKLDAKATKKDNDSRRADLLRSAAFDLHEAVSDSESKPANALIK